MTAQKLGDVIVDFEEFRRAHLQELLRFARVLVGHPDAAEDIVQEVVIRLFVSSKVDVTKIQTIGPYARRMVAKDGQTQLGSFVVDGQHDPSTRPAPRVADR